MNTYRYKEMVKVAINSWTIRADMKTFAVWQNQSPIRNETGNANLIVPT